MDVELQFPVGAKVKLSAEAVRMFPRRKGETGNICGYSREGLPKVAWNKRKMVDSWHPSLLHRTPHPL